MDSWSNEKGSMMAIEGGLEDVERLLSKFTAHAEAAATIACFNRPRSFTLAGSSKAIMIRETVPGNAAFSPSVKVKKLDVPNAFYSALVEPLMLDLEQVGQDLAFKEPIIPLERATKSANTSTLNSSFVAAHLRNPVYFNHAVQRLSQRYPSGIWLESGSNSTITTMANRALESPSSSLFQSINLSSNGAFQFLTDATKPVERRVKHVILVTPCATDSNV
jgi:acyl transferase domain-containing protein